MLQNLDASDKPLNPRDASVYLAAAGIPFQESTLCKLRCIGGGPRYLKNGSRVFYRPSALSEWLQSRTSELTHTSQAA
jgi:hypothetical protein